MPVSLVIFLGLANWIITVILVESELSRPFRLWVSGTHFFAPARPKLAYLVSCHLCTGTWVGLALALVAGSPVPGVLGLVVGGLIYKAVGHVTLEVTAALKRVGT